MLLCIMVHGASRLSIRPAVSWIPGIYGADRDYTLLILLLALDMQTRQWISSGLCDQEFFVRGRKFPNSTEK